MAIPTIKRICIPQKTANSLSIRDKKYQNTVNVMKDGEHYKYKDDNTVYRLLSTSHTSLCIYFSMQYMKDGCITCKDFMFDKDEQAEKYFKLYPKKPFTVWWKYYTIHHM